MIEYLRRIRQTLGDARALRNLPALDCSAESLRSANEVNLARIFGSEQIGTAWNAAAPELATFDIPDGTPGVNAGDRRAIFYFCSYFTPHSILEVGTNIGSSTTSIAAAIKRYEKVEGAKPLNFVSVDVCDMNDPIAKPWLQYGTWFSPAEAIERMECDHCTQFVSNTSLDYMSSTGHRFDLIFLDGDHAAATVYQEIPAALELLNTDGLILLHDYFPRKKPLWSDGCVIPGPFHATERLIAEGAQFEVLPLGRLPWSTKLRSDVTSLALLARKSK